MSNTIPASTLDKFTTFGDLLRFLRRREGITQVELSIAVGYSDAQISRLEQNLRLPDIPTIQARFVPALDLEDEPKAVARLLDLAAQVRREDAPGPGLCPYKGLNYFDETDAELFAGREALTAKLTERVLALISSGEPSQAKFLAVVGASGSGKSSLVRAGLVPALRWNKVSASWPIQVLIPTAHPLENLAASLTQENGSLASTAALMDDLLREPRSLSLFIQRALRAARVSHFLLVVDQFEELFALCRSEDERRAFIDNLLTACEADGPALLIITLRADFYAACAGYPCLREALARQQEYIGAMSDEELRRAIEEPARRGRWELEAGLADLLLHDVGHEPGALPLLSHALMETWQRRRGRMLTLSGYTSSGGVRGAIAETAEAVFADQFTPEQRAIARRIFLRLTELSDETAAGETRRRAAFNELILKPEEAAATQGVLKALADARLITTSEDSVEVAHEALIREWPTLRGWIEDDRESLRLHRHLTETAQEWQAAGSEPDLLYRGARLAQAREWAAANAEEMNPLERGFLAASIESSEREAAEREAQRQRELEAAQKLAETQQQRAEEQARSAGQLRKRAIYLTAALVIALGMALVALFFGAQARQAAIVAESERRLGFARELTSEAINNLDVDPERSLLLAMQAISTTYTSDGTWTAEAEDALRQSLEASRLLLTFHAHSDSLASIAFSPDGSRLATASDDGTVKIWDAASGQVQLSITTQANGRRQGIAFSPDGARLVTPGEKGTAVVWDSASGEALLTLHGHIDGVLSAAFSPEGSRLVTASQDGTAKIWDAATGRLLLNLMGHFAGVNHAAFSPDGRRVATASDDGTATVWDAASGQAQFTLRADTEWVSTVVFSPDGTRLATANNDKTVRIWDAANGQELLTLHGHTDWVADAAFSPDGSRLATAGFDGKVKVWDAATGQELLTLSGHTDAVVGLAFSPDCDRTPGARREQCGTRLATASLDGTARVWDASFSREWLTFSFPGVNSGKFSPAGNRAASGYPDGSIKIWAIPTTVQETYPNRRPGAAAAKELLTLRAHLGVVTRLAFSPDGRRLASASEDQTVITWDAASGAKLHTLRGHTSWVSHVVFSPDGKRLASISRDPTLILWDAETGQALRTQALPGWSNCLAFNPDGKLLAIGIGVSVQVEAAETGEVLLNLVGHRGNVLGVAFSPDGKRLATASYDGNGILWDAETGQALLALRGHIGPIYDIAFSPDGERLATVGQDGSVKLWDAATGQLIHTFDGFDNAVMDVAFSSDGKRLFAGTLDGIARVYLLQMNDLMDLAARRLNRSLTTAECQQYLHRSQGQCGEEVAASSQQPTPDAALQTSPAQAPASKGKMCELIDNSGAYEKYVSQGAYEGLQRAMAAFGWEPDQLETQEINDPELEFKRLMQSGCSLIVAPTGFYYAGAIKAAFEANPAQKTLVIDWPFDTSLDNLWSQTYATNQAAFLAGYAAAAVSKTGKVATFGGIQTPTVTAFMDGFALGVDFYNQKNGARVEVLGWDVAKHSGLFTDNFIDLDVGHRMGERLLDQGADVILPVAGQLSWGTAAAVKERGNALVIGVDFDWAASNREYADFILTSVEKRVDVSVASAVKAVVEGTFTGGVHTGTLENGEVGLAPFYNLDGLVGPQVKADLEQIMQDIIAGKIKTTP